MRAPLAAAAATALLALAPPAAHAQGEAPGGPPPRPAEREVGVPDFPYDPQARGEARRKCAGGCISRRRGCERSAEADARDCEVGFLLCARACAEGRGAAGGP